MTAYPEWLWGLSWGCLGLAFLSGIIILADEVRRPQKMFIMNLVWPITAYFNIIPMPGLTPGKGIVAAIRADTLSIVAFQLGLFGWMAVVYFVIFTNPHSDSGERVFWFTMQTGMIIGFFTSYPANVFLLKNGWKEKMG